MRAVVSRVTKASVTVAGEEVGGFDEPGLLVLLGITRTDGTAEIAWMAGKIAHLRILPGERSVYDAKAPVLVVSQFTLYGDASKGRRPTWQAAAPGETAEPVYDAVCAGLENEGIVVHRGRFGGDMSVSSVNHGPFTVILDRSFTV